jgi:PST family polysaccharide transporter
MIFNNIQEFILSQTYKVNKIYQEKKVQISNFGYLTILQTVNMLLPLIIFPYLISHLGSSVYGLVIFADTIIRYFIVFIGFGFNLSATKKISENRSNKEKVIEIFSSVISIKLFFLLISFVVFFIMINTFSIFSQHKELYYFSMLLCIGEVILPVWYFQGIEKMKYITYINTAIKIIATVLIIAFIESADDYYMVPLFNGVGISIGAFISLYIMMKYEKIRFKFQSIKKMLEYIKESYVFFVSDAAAIGKDKVNIILIGSFIGMTEVAYYELADKIVWAFRSVFVNFNNAFFPHIANKKNKILVRKIIKFITISSIVSYLLLVILAKTLVLLLGNDSMLESVKLIYILGVFLIFAGVSGGIGNFVLVINNLNKEFLYNMLLTTAIYFIIILSLYLLDIITLINLAVGYIMSIVFEMLHRLYICKKNNLFDWIKG